MYLIKFGVNVPRAIFTQKISSFTEALTEISIENFLDLCFQTKASNMKE